MNIKTHLQIDNTLCGRVVANHQGYAKVVLHTTYSMSADSMGLVHGGFVFGAADYAAMVAVNDELVVLGSATSKFVAPVRVGDVVVLEANVISNKKSKYIVQVIAKVDNKVVFEGEFITFVLKEHVLAK
jgi:acyl-coenzyme A thioesterase PaaI-like protein